jgi:hypothetical protein
MVRKALCRVGCRIVLTSFLIAVPSDKAHGEENLDFGVITLRGTMTIQRDNTVSQIVDIGQSYILDPTDDNHRSVRVLHREPINERLELQLHLIIERPPQHFHTTIHGAALLLLNNSQGENEIVMMLPVDIPLLAVSTNHRVEDSVTNGQHTLSVDLTFSSQSFTCDPVVDADCDTLPNTLETALIERFKPVFVFADDEPVPLDEIAVVYQVSPKVLDIGGPVEIMITVVVLYTQDKGVYHLTITGWNHLTCNVLVIGQELELGLPLVPAELLKMPINTHCGDSEDLRLLVTKSEADWILTAVYLRQHDDPWQVFVGEAISETFTFSQAVSTGVDHLALYVSYAKHSMYPDPVTCAAYKNVTPVPGLEPWACTVTFEVCGTDSPVLLDTPVSHNVGERHRPAFDLMTASSSPVLQQLFPNEYTWTESAFCGGCSEIPDPAYGLGEWCAGSLTSKWWPPTNNPISPALSTTLRSGPPPSLPVIP